MDNFACIGGSCDESCCDGWVVAWTKEEVDKLRSAEMSDHLREIADKSFKMTDDGWYRIEMLISVAFGDEDKGKSRLRTNYRCPFHNRQTGLCDIQKELGEDYLSGVCRYYPRKYISYYNTIIKSCSATCPAVLDCLFNDGSCMDLVLTPARDYKMINKTAHGKTIGENAIVKYPILNHMFEITDFYFDLYKNKNRSMEIFLILGALAAKHISDAANNKEFKEIPIILKNLKSQLNSPSVIKSLSEIKPNLELKFKLVNNMIVKFFGAKCERELDITPLHDGKAVISENYSKGWENFCDTFKDRGYILKNVFMNTFLDTIVHLDTFDLPFFERYSYFILCCAVFRTVAVTLGFTSDNIEGDFRKVVSKMSRMISHNVSAAKDIANDMKETGLTTPAHLALIIK